MSTTNTENLILYSCKKLYNGSRYKVYQSGTGFNYDTWLANTDNSPNNSGNLTVYFKSITEPITIDAPLMNTDTYTYGCITNGTDGTHYKKYYFFVDNITTDQNGRSTLSFSIDWWATEWSNIQLTTGHITRNKNTKPGYMAQPYTPLNESVQLSNFTQTQCYMATYIPSNDSGKSYISTLVFPYNQYMYKLVENGMWYSEFKIPGADIKDSFVVPVISYDFYKSQVEYITAFYVEGADDTERKRYLHDTYYHYFADQVFEDTLAIDLNTSEMFNVRYDSTQPTNMNIYPYPYKRSHQYIEIITQYLGVSNERNIYYLMENNINLNQVNFSQYVTPISTTVSTNMTSNEINKQGIIDWNGNLIWECPYNISITGFNVDLLKGLSHVMLQFTPINGNQGDLLTGKGFCYDCRHPGLFVDSYQDYILKNRDYDIHMRQLQSEKQELQAWASTAENIGFGMAFGQTTGAAAAGIGGVIEAASTWLLNQHFDPKIQQQYDLKYARMTDQISLIGDSITNQRLQNPLSKYTLTMDSATQNRMNNDINTNGYYCDETIGNLQSLITPGNVVQADNVTVEGLICKEGRQQIVYRLQNGVEFI